MTLQAPAASQSSRLDFVRIYVGYGRFCVALFDLPMEGTDPGFDDAAGHKRHVKYRAVIRQCAGVQFTPGRLAAAL